MTQQIRILGLFPGQGSQQVGMGKDFYDASPMAREIFQRADDALGFKLSAVCFNGPQEELTRTAIAQPAILTVSVIAYELAREGLGDKLALVAAAGHSLGEYSAHVAAGSLAFEDAVRLVHLRGTYMQEAVPVGAGKMLAVMGVPVEKLEQVCAEVSERGIGSVEIANVNDTSQIVVAGSAAAVDALPAALEGARTVALSVSAPFHCSLMKPAAERLKNTLAGTAIQNPRIPVFANYTGRPVNSAEEIRELLYQQVCGRVRWVECMQNAIALAKPTLSVEFGNGTVLSGLLRRIQRDMPRANIETMQSISDLMKTL